MIEEKTSELSNSSFESAISKIYKVNLYNGLAIIISGAIIALSLLTGWALWLTFFDDGINYYINFINNSIPNSFTLNFAELSIIIFAVSALAFGLVVLPFIFFRTKNSICAFFSLISFIFSMVLVIGFIIIVYTRFDIIKSLITNEAGASINTISLINVIFLPWLLAALSALFLLGHSICLLINITSKYRSNALLVTIANAKQPNLNPIFDENTADNFEENEISIPLVTPQPEVSLPINSPQPVNITVTNNTTIPNTSPQNRDLSENATLIYTNPSFENTSITGAYASEAVVSNNTQESTTLRLIDPILENGSQVEETIIPSSNTSIYSQTTNISSASSSISKYDDLVDENKESDVLISNATINQATVTYEPQNQGGFDIQSEQQNFLDEAQFSSESPMTNPPNNISPVNTVGKPSNTKKEKLPSTKRVYKTTKSIHWTLEQIQTVWEKAETIEGVSDKLYRKDYAGAWMFRDSFTYDLTEADNEKTYSWTIVLHRPISQGGTTELYNLDPMNVVNAKTKAENYPRWTTKLSSRGNENIIKEQNWKART